MNANYYLNHQRNKRKVRKEFALGLDKSVEHLIEELKKCQLLCKSCHIEKTRQENTGRFVRPITHGTLSGYQHYRCRCIDCKKANARYKLAWKVGKQHGQHTT